VSIEKIPITTKNQALYGVCRVYNSPTKYREHLQLVFKHNNIKLIIKTG